MSKQLIVYQIEKEEVFNKDYSRIKDLFSTLEMMGKKARGNVMLLVDGYNDIATELQEIPEVREFTKGLFERFPYLLYFINFELEGHHWLLASLLDFEMFSFHEKVPADKLFETYGLNLPRNLVHMKIPKEQLGELLSNIKRFGSKVNDLKGANLVVKQVTDIFGEV